MSGLVTRRSFFGLLAAPAVIRVAQLMPISVPKLVVPAFTYEEAPASLIQYGNMVFAEREMLKWARPVLVLEKLARPQPQRLNLPPVFHAVKFRRPVMVP